VDELMQLGRIVPGSRVDLAKSGVGVAVRSGARKPDIGSVEAPEDGQIEFDDNAPLSDSAFYRTAAPLP